MLVRELIERLQKLPQNRIVEICIPADVSTDPDEPATNIDDLYSGIVEVCVKGDVVTLKGEG